MENYNYLENEDWKIPECPLPKVRVRKNIKKFTINNTCTCVNYNKFSEGYDSYAETNNEFSFVDYSHRCNAVYPSNDIVKLNDREFTEKSTKKSFHDIRHPIITEQELEKEYILMMNEVMRKLKQKDIPPEQVPLIYEQLKELKSFIKTVPIIETSEDAIRKRRMFISWSLVNEYLNMFKKRILPLPECTPENNFIKLERIKEFQQNILDLIQNYYNYLLCNTFNNSIKFKFPFSSYALYIGIIVSVLMIYYFLPDWTCSSELGVQNFLLCPIKGTLQNTHLGTVPY